MTGLTLDESPTTPGRRRWLSVLRSRAVVVPVSAFVISRLGILLLAYIGLALVPEASPPPYHLRGTDNALLDVLGSRWDTGFYVSIAEEGYRVDSPPGLFPSVPFFPLLPLLMRAGAVLTGDVVTAGIVINHLALLGAALLFYQLAAQQWGEGVADRAVWYLLIFPTAFFGSALYGESLFLLLTIGALYGARNGRWGLAALCAIGATATRFVGLIVVPMLIMEWLLQRSHGEKPGWQGLAVAAAAPLGLASYMLYLWQRFGDPLAFFSASAAWGRTPQAAWLTIRGLFQAPPQGWSAALLAGRLPLNDWLDLGFVVLFFGLGFVLLYQHEWSMGLFVWLGLLIPFSSGLLMSQRRYVWVLFPAFILLARWGERAWVDRLITSLSLFGLALFTVLFANGYWVG